MKIYLYFLYMFLILSTFWCSAHFFELNGDITNRDEDAHTDCVNACWIFLLQNAQHKQRIWKENFYLTAKWPLNQCCLLRYANDREAERWLELPLTSTERYCYCRRRNATDSPRRRHTLPPTTAFNSLGASAIGTIFHNVFHKCYIFILFGMCEFLRILWLK